MDIVIQENSQYGLVVSSRTVAQELGKRHTEVLRALKGILTDVNLRSLIIESNYIDKKGQSRKEYLLTKDGFTLYMFNIQGYQDFKIAYIQKFNEMEKALYSKQAIEREQINIRELSYDRTLIQIKAFLNNLKSRLLAERTEIDEKIKVLDRTGLTSKMQSYISNGEVVVVQDVN